MYGLPSSQEQILSMGVPSVPSRRKNTAFGSSVQILTLGPEDGSFVGLCAGDEDGGVIGYEDGDIVGVDVGFDVGMLVG